MASVEFVLLATQRSGSTWVVDMLNSHPQIIAYSELFLEDAQGTPQWGGARDMVFWTTHYAQRKQESPGISRDQVVRDYLHKLYSSHPEMPAIGFKLMYGQFGAFPELDDYFRTEELRIIHLIRKNVLDIVISKCVAAVHDVYHIRQGSDVEPVAIKLDTGELPKRLANQEEQVTRARRQFAGRGSRYHEVFYEDLASNCSHFSELLQFLCVDASVELKSTLKRLNPRTQPEVIENYDEVHRALQGTRYECYLSNRTKVDNS
jgi:LPS sulfotransferase NodH